MWIITINFTHSDSDNNHLQWQIPQQWSSLCPNESYLTSGKSSQLERMKKSHHVTCRSRAAHMVHSLSMINLAQVAYFRCASDFRLNTWTRYAKRIDLLSQWVYRLHLLLILRELTYWKRCQISFTYHLLHFSLRWLHLLRSAGEICLLQLNAFRSPLRIINFATSDDKHPRCRKKKTLPRAKIETDFRASFRADSNIPKHRSSLLNCKV